MTDHPSFIGRQSVQFSTPVFLSHYCSVAGKKEGEGPLKKYFDFINEDALWNADCWEKAEGNMQKKALSILFEKSGLSPAQIRMVFSGDLLAQSIASCVGVKDFCLPYYGLFGACSTIGEALSLGALTIAGGFSNYTISMASSHFGSAEKEFRFPLEYGSQRPLSASWTVTACGACLLSTMPSSIAITGITTGKIVDYGLKDSFNMGGCMAPAACDTILQNFMDFHRTPSDYDKIITGDLGQIGSDILKDLLRKEGFDISARHDDCGLIIYDREAQDIHAGGSGCGCSASVLTSFLLPAVSSGKYQRILFVPTGALLSKVSYNEGFSIPGIAHAVIIEHQTSTERRD